MLVQGKSTINTPNDLKVLTVKIHPIFFAPLRAHRDDGDSLGNGMALSE